MAKILLVEDDPIAARLIARILARDQHDLSVATSAVEAMKKAEKDIPDLFILDIMMPGIDGLTLLTKMRQLPRYRLAPVIMCSTIGDPKTVVKCLKAGASDYVIKPVQATALLTKITKALNNAAGSVLIVDDEQAILEALTRIAAKEGFRTMAASSGEAALSLMANHRVSVLVTDLQMPGMDGLELVTQVRSKYPDTPSLVVSGHSEDFGRDKVMAAGAHGMISKPFKENDVAKQLHTLMAKAMSGLKSTDAPADR